MSIELYSSNLNPLMSKLGMYGFSMDTREQVSKKETSLINGNKGLKLRQRRTGSTGVKIKLDNIDHVFLDGLTSSTELINKNGEMHGYEVSLTPKVNYQQSQFKRFEDLIYEGLVSNSEILRIYSCIYPRLCIGRLNLPLSGYLALTAFELLFNAKEDGFEQYHHDLEYKVFADKRQIHRTFLAEHHLESGTSIITNIMLSTPRDLTVILYELDAYLQSERFRINEIRSLFNLSTSLSFI